MSKFSDFVKDDNNVKIKEERGENKTEDIENLIHKYSEYSENDLMTEFLKESARKKENGEFSDEKIASIKNILSPYLDESQKQKLNDLLNMVK